MNKKLVYICNSLERLKLLDKYNFKEQFNGELYIVSDDRYMEIYKDIQKFINEEASNVNIKNSKFISMKNDVIPFVMSKMDIAGYEEDFKKLLFLSTLITPIYFCREPEDISLIVEDDCLLFKNPYDMMTGLKTCSTTKLPATCATDEKLYNYFNAVDPDFLKEINLDKDNLVNNIYKKYGKIISQATTTWTYLPNFPKYLSNFIKLPSSVRNIQQNRKKGCKLYHRGFTLSLELFVSCILIVNHTKYYNDREIILQDRTRKICRDKDINNIVGYHYTIISDEFIFEFLPVLLEGGYEKYKEKLKDYQYEKRNKFNYLDNKLMVGFAFNGNLKKPTLKVNHRRLI